MTGIAGTVKRITAKHYPHRSGTSTYSRRRYRHYAKVSVWSEVEAENGKTYSVWIGKVPGREFVPVQQQLQEALSSHQRIIGKKIMFRREFVGLLRETGVGFLIGVLPEPSVQT